MDWFEPVMAYCERTGPAFWAEPVNALTNAAFLIAAALLCRRADVRGDPPALALAILTGIVGIGSFLFHTLAVHWSMLADVIPIALFIGTVGAVSVIKAVYIDRRSLRCACVGGNSNVPLGAVSLDVTVLAVGAGRRVDHGAVQHDPRPAR